MQNTLALFDKWKVQIPEERRKMYLHSCQEQQEENVLYMICCWDYFYNPNDEKLEGLIKVFIMNGATGNINVGSWERDRALGLLENPLLVKRDAIAQGVLKGPGRKARAANFDKPGGAHLTGVANYNLMTQAMELTLPTCMSKVALKNNGDIGDLQPTANGQTIVRDVATYWGAAVLGLTIT